MRAVVQRVTRAAVEVDGEVVGALDEGALAASSTGQGLLVLVGVTHDDDPAQAAALAAKVAGLRVLTGEVSALDAGAPVLVVSQFTLYADTRGGRRPSWSAAAPAAAAAPLVEAVVAGLRDAGLTVSTGIFGAEMAVSSVNAGPMTVLLEV